MRYAATLVVVPLLLGFAGQGVASERALECAEMEEAVDRLACFDEVFSSAESERASGVPGSTPLAAPAPVPERVPPVPGAEREAAPADSALTDTQKDGGGGVRGWLGNRQPGWTSTIVSLRKADKQKMLFLLANDQVWIQSTPRPLPFREGDIVTVESALLGGHFMSSTHGTRTRVQRIR